MKTRSIVIVAVLIFIGALVEVILIRTYYVTLPPRGSGPRLLVFRVVQPVDGDVVQGIIQVVIESNLNIDHSITFEVVDVSSESRPISKGLSNFTLDTNNLPNGEYTLRISGRDLSIMRTYRDSAVIHVENPNPTVLDSAYLYSIGVNGTFGAGEVHMLIVERLSVSSANPTYSIKEPQNLEITLLGTTISAVHNRGVKIEVEFDQPLPNWMLEALNELMENLPQLLQPKQFPERD